ncbi:hypothetical protein DFJ74DRAFT_660918 [Hyaloraphidium curvatum]|nr:hypothetical protein DFJ74DRAFT_660918 [Hyaloraphidium curvatum]
MKGCFVVIVSRFGVQIECTHNCGFKHPSDDPVPFDPSSAPNLSAFLGMKFVPTDDKETLELAEHVPGPDEKLCREVATAKFDPKKEFNDQGRLVDYLNTFFSVINGSKSILYRETLTSPWKEYTEAELKQHLRTEIPVVRKNTKKQLELFDIFSMNRNRNIMDWVKDIKEDIATPQNWLSVLASHVVDATEPFRFGDYVVDLQGIRPGCAAWVDYVALEAIWKTFATPGMPMFNSITGSTKQHTPQKEILVAFRDVIGGLPDGHPCKGLTVDIKRRGLGLQSASEPKVKAAFGVTEVSCYALKFERVSVV